MKKYTSVRMSKEYKQKLAELAALNKRSMANMLEILIDKELKA